MLLDSSPAWFSWIGACAAALNIHASLDHTQVERHATGRAPRFVDTARSIGYSSPAYDLPSHIAVLNCPVIPYLSDLLREGCAGIPVWTVNASKTSVKIETPSMR